MNDCFKSLKSDLLNKPMPDNDTFKILSSKIKNKLNAKIQSFYFDIFIGSTINKMN